MGSLIVMLLIGIYSFTVYAIIFWARTAAQPARWMRLAIAIAAIAFQVMMLLVMMIEFILGPSQ